MVRKDGEKKRVLGDVLTSCAVDLRGFLPRKGNGVDVNASN